MTRRRLTVSPLLGWCSQNVTNYIICDYVSQTVRLCHTPAVILPSWPPEPDLYWNLNKTIQAHHEKVKNYTVRQDLKIRLMTIQYNLKFRGWVEKVNSEADTTKTTVYHMTLFQAPTNCMEDIFHLFYFTLVLENNTFICDNQSVAYRQKDQGFLFIFYCFPFVKKFEIRISQLV